MGPDAMLEGWEHTTPIAMAVTCRGRCDDGVGAQSGHQS
jgi:hypothetical protein